MADKLKIYACSGIGDSENAAQPKMLGYWLDSTNTISNTQAVNSLLVQINSNRIKAYRLQTITAAAKIDCLNRMDFYYVCLLAARRFEKDNEALYRAGAVIAKMYDDGMFLDLNLDDRETHLAELIAHANSAFDSDETIEFVNKTIEAWWNKSVIARNKNGLNFGQQQNLRKALKKSAEKISGIGAVDESWKDDPDLAKYLNKGSEYFLYLYYTEDQLKKLPAIFRIKKEKQMTTYNYCKQLFVDVYGTEEDMQDIIYHGIMDYFGATPEEVCNDIIKGKIKPVGIATEVIVALIGAAVTLITGIITAICSMVAQTNIAKYGALDEEIVNSSVPNEDDYNDVNWNPTKKSNWLLLAVAGIAAVLLLKK